MSREVKYAEDHFRFIDMFCGCGGVTQGVIKAKHQRKRLVNVVAAVNHDPLAIQTHAKNHKNVLHYDDDVVKMDEKSLPYLGTNGILWASVDCTQHSRAKGGKPRDPDSRVLPNELPRFVSYLNPDYLIVENVEDFLKWGKLDKNNRPVKTDRGSWYRRWVKSIEKLGYVYDYKILNAADYGAYTNRKRYFGIFAKPGLPIVFPKPTHSKTGGNGLKKHRAVKEKLDLQDEGKSIFNRKKPLVDNTLKRIEYGVKKFCLDKFLIKYYGNGKNAEDVNEPLDTITTNDRFALVCPKKEKKRRFTTQNIQMSINANSIDKPLGTILTRDEKTLITVVIDEEKKEQFLTKYFGGEQHGVSIDDPAATITPIDHHALITVEGQKVNLLMSHNFKDKPKSIEEPCRTINAQDRISLLGIELKETQFIKSDYSGGGFASSINSPLPTITTNNKHSLITLLVDLGIIKDIKMRFLKPDELKTIQGFPKGYKLLGNNKYQKKFIGNSVCPIVAQRIIEALYTANGSAGVHEPQLFEEAA